MGFFDDVFDVVGDIGGGLVSAGKEAGKFVKGNPELVSVGAGLYDAYQGNQQNQNIIDLYKDTENQNYNQSKANYDAYQQWALGESARRRADAGARAAAARENERRRLAAAAEAQAQMDQTRKKTLNVLKPYRRAAKQILPGQVEARLGGQQLAQDLVGKIQNQQAVRPQDILMPIPDYLGR